MTELTSINKQKPEVVERFVALAPAEYFRCINDDVNDRIKNGHILLVTSIDNVDNQAHTIYVRLHPSEIKEHYSDTVKFLTADFLSNFEHVTQEVGKQQRTDALADIQKQLNNAQAELQSALTDPKTLDHCVERDTPPEESKSSDNQAKALPIQYEPLKADVTKALQTQQLTALMAPDMDERGIENIKINLEHHKNVAVRRANWIAKKTSSLSKIAEQMTPYFLEQSAMALAATSDITKQISEIMKGIGNLNLYVLKNVEITPIKKGLSAPRSTKLTIAQKTLFMDEELAVFREVNESFDCQDRELFFTTLAENEKLVKQIFPTERCIVGLATTRGEKGYAEMGYHSAQVSNLEAENARVFFIVRDGENFNAVLSPECFHQFTATLFPSMDELERPFKGFNGSEITYNDINYTNSLSAYKRIELAYKRMLILICGLDHNKDLFGDFYDGAKSLDFMTMDFQEAYFNFIHDADGTGLVANPHRPISYQQWIKELNSEIESGSRVLIPWRSAFSVESISGAYQRQNQWHNHPTDRDLLYTPKNQGKYLLATVKKAKGRLVIDVEVSGHNHDYKHRSFTTQLDIQTVLQEDCGRSIFCLDRFKAEDALWYLNDRVSRTLNITGIDLLKDVIEYAKSERIYEKPVHDVLTKAITDAKIITDSETIMRLIDKALAKWRCTYPNKDVLTLLSDTKLFNKLCDQIYHLSDVSKDITDQIIQAEEALNRKVVRVSLTANGQYCAYSTPLESEKDDRLVPFDWCSRTRYLIQKKGVKAQPHTFALIRAIPNDETVKFEAENIKDYVNNREAYFSSPKQKNKILNIADPLKALANIEAYGKDDQSFYDLLEEYNSFRQDVSKNHVYEPTTTVVLGHCITYGKVSAIGLITPTIDVLAHLACHDELRTRILMKVFVSMYENKQSGKSRLLDMLDTVKDKTLFELFDLATLKADDFDEDENLFVSFNHSKSRIAQTVINKYSLQKRIDNFSKKERSPIYLHPSIASNLDEAIKLIKPKNYFPCLYSKDNDKESFILKTGSVVYMHEYQEGLKSQLVGAKEFESKEALLEHIKGLSHAEIKDLDDMSSAVTIKFKATEIEVDTSLKNVPLKSWRLEKCESPSN